MPAGAKSRTPATDFVYDYAAKRQAQMERARQLREDRLQQQQQCQSPFTQNSGDDGVGNPYAASPKYTTASSAKGNGAAAVVGADMKPPPPNVPRLRHPTSGHSSVDSGAPPGKGEDGPVLYVKERDFKQATQAGIITPDQARQLWAMLSNQIIRVCSPSAHANAVSVSSLLALSRNSYNSSGRAAGGLQSAEGSEFGASISLESLRTSIAYFKREQQRLLQQQGGGGGTTGAPSQGRHPLSSSPPALNSTAGQPASQSRGLPSRQSQYEANIKNNHYQDDDGASKDEQRALATPLALRSGGGGGAGRGGRPAWNADVEVHHEDDYDDDRNRHAPSSPSAISSGGAALKKPRTGKTNAVRSAPKGAAAPSSSAARAGVGGVRGTSSQAGAGQADGGYGNDSERNCSNVYMPPQSSPPVSRSSKAGGTGAAPRRPPATRATAPPPSSGAPINLDDVPVGGGGGGGMNDWANAYPPGMAPPVLAGGNDTIAAEAAAAAQEPMQKCRICSRSFRISVIIRHEALCRKQASKPRNVFDMREQRLDGVEGIKEVQRAATRAGGGGGGGRGGGRGGGGDVAAAAAAKGKLPKWKIQHEQFQAAMRAVRRQQEGGGGGFGSGQMAPPPPPIPDEYDDRVLCPHCGRKFAQEVAARHIPKCATTIAKPKGIRPIRR
ncbi:putative zinc-finger of a C2HC-type [Leishmania utingensis]|uniref:Zinc-finger of a C2HC-type n=1 Tax=Leishmania utingensis TaxID=653362 RepID=A0AAW3AFU4_9TRYP